MIKNKKELCGIVILYNPETDKLISNIKTYINNLSGLYIFCNSPFDSKQIANQFSKSEINIKIIQNPFNYGIAKVLNVAAELAIHEGYEWMLTMDQDSYFIDDSFFESCLNYLSEDNIAILSPVHLSGIHEIPKNQVAVKRANYVMTSGNLLNLSLWKKLNGFYEPLFIDEVDTEFCYRCLKFNYKILIFTNSILIHNLGVMGKTYKLPFSNKEKILIGHSAHRFYFISRNNLYILKKYIFNFPMICGYRFYISFVKKITFTLLYGDNKSQIAKQVFKGITHFIIGKYTIPDNKFLNE